MMPQSALECPGEPSHHCGREAVEGTEDRGSWAAAGRKTGLLTPARSQQKFCRQPISSRVHSTASRRWMALTTILGSPHFTMADSILSSVITFFNARAAYVLMNSSVTAINLPSAGERGGRPGGGRVSFPEPIFPVHR